ncbi:hypothetical protein BBAL3_492 [Brevundimonas sp. BAL3]|nr:hypothetical protein BBAL3_492 [Brevundimonas sp. BAL3]
MPLAGEHTLNGSIQGPTQREDYHDQDAFHRRRGARFRRSGFPQLRPILLAQLGQRIGIRFGRPVSDDRRDLQCLHHRKPAERDQRAHSDPQHHARQRPLLRRRTLRILERRRGAGIDHVDLPDHRRQHRGQRPLLRHCRRRLEQCDQHGHLQQQCAAARKRRRSQLHDPQRPLRRRRPLRCPPPSICGTTAWPI